MRVSTEEPTPDPQPGQTSNATPVGPVEWLQRLAPFLPVLVALVYGFIQGSFAPGAKDIDTRYFFVAGKAWIRGLSPYDFEVYRAIWFEHFTDSIAPGVFAYLPGSIAYTLPLGLFDWPTAALVFRGINILAVVAIAYLCISALGLHSKRPRATWHLVPLSVGLCFGGVAGTILTGQSTLIVCAASLALLTLPKQRSILIGIAILVASSKPQLSLPAMLVAILANRSARGRLLALTGLAVLASIAVLLLDRAPASHLAQSLTSNASLGANSFHRMIGLSPLLQAATMGPSASKAAAMLAFGALLVYVVIRSLRGTSDFDARTVMLCFAAAGIGYPVHEYDTAILVPVCAFAVLLTRTELALVAAPILFLSRPGLVKRILHLAAGANGDAARNTFASACWVTLAAILLVGAVVAWRREEQAPPRPDL